MNRLLFSAAIAWTVFSAGAGTTNLNVGYCTDDPAAAKAAGFDYFELRVREIAKMSDEDFAKFVARCEAVGLPARTGNLLFPGDLKVVGPDVRTNEVMSYARKAFDRCAKLGVRIVVWGSGESRRAPEGFSRDVAFEQLVALARTLAPEAEKRGITLVVEPLRKAESNTINSAAEGLKWVEAVGHPNFQLLVDLYHLTEEAEDPAILVKAGSHLRHVHFANPHGRTFPRRDDGFDYAPFFLALNRAGYQGAISVEARTERVSVDGPAAIALIRGGFAAAARQVEKEKPTHPIP